MSKIGNHENAKIFAGIEKGRVKTPFFVEKFTMILDENDKYIIESPKTASRRHFLMLAGGLTGKTGDLAGKTGVLAGGFFALILLKKPRQIKLGRRSRRNRRFFRF